MALRLKINEIGLMTITTLNSFRINDEDTYIQMPQYIFTTRIRIVQTMELNTGHQKSRLEKVLKVLNLMLEKTPENIMGRQENKQINISPQGSYPRHKCLGSIYHTDIM